MTGIWALAALWLGLALLASLLLGSFLELLAFTS